MINLEKEIISDKKAAAEGQIITLGGTPNESNNFSHIYYQSSCKVLNTYFQNGDNVKKGDTVFKVLSSSGLYLCKITEQEACLIKKGQKAQITSWKNPGKIYYGEIESILSLKDGKKENFLLRIKPTDSAFPPKNCKGLTVSIQS